MSVGDKIESLKHKHALLDAAVWREAARSVPDQTTLSVLKRQKLMIKDEIVRLGRTDPQLELAPARGRLRVSFAQSSDASFVDVHDDK